MPPRRAPRSNETALTMVGAQVAAARAAKGMTQRALAEALHIDVETVASIEQGRRALMPNVAEKMDRALDLPGLLAVAANRMPEVNTLLAWRRSTSPAKPRPSPCPVSRPRSCPACFRPRSTPGLCSAAACPISARRRSSPRRHAASSVRTSCTAGSRPLSVSSSRNQRCATVSAAMTSAGGSCTTCANALTSQRSLSRSSPSASPVTQVWRVRSPCWKCPITSASRTSRTSASASSSGIR